MFRTIIPSRLGSSTRSPSSSSFKEIRAVSYHEACDFQTEPLRIHAHVRPRRMGDARVRDYCPPTAPKESAFLFSDYNMLIIAFFFFNQGKMAQFLLNLSIFSQPFLVCSCSSTQHSFPVLLPSSASGSRTVLPGCSFSVTTESPHSCLTPCPGLLALLRLQPLEEKLSQRHIVTHHLSADSSRLLVRERTRARYA